MVSRKMDINDLSKKKGKPPHSLDILTNMLSRWLFGGDVICDSLPPGRLSELAGALKKYEELSYSIYTRMFPFYETEELDGHEVSKISMIYQKKAASDPQLTVCDVFKQSIMPVVKAHTSVGDFKRKNSELDVLACEIIIERLIGLVEMFGHDILISAGVRLITIGEFLELNSIQKVEYYKRTLEHTLDMFKVLERDLEVQSSLMYSITRLFSHLALACVRGKSEINLHKTEKN
jgi:hypothetical protein